MALFLRFLFFCLLLVFCLGVCVVLVVVLACFSLGVSCVWALCVAWCVSRVWCVVFGLLLFFSARVQPACLSSSLFFLPPCFARPGRLLPWLLLASFASIRVRNG